jgi:hypothetical protein
MASLVASLDNLLRNGKAEWAQSSWTPKSLRRWLALYVYFDALLSWHGYRRMKVVTGHRASYLP